MDVYLIEVGIEKRKFMAERLAYEDEWHRDGGDRTEIELVSSSLIYLEPSKRLSSTLAWQHELLHRRSSCQMVHSIILLLLILALGCLSWSDR